MWIKHLIHRSSTSALRPGSSPGCHTWILLAIIHLTMDFSACSPPTPGLGGKLTARSVPRLKTSPTILWEAPSRPPWRSQGLGWKKGLHPLQQPTNKAGRSPTLVGQKRRGPTHGGPGCEECPLQTASGDAQASPASPEGRSLDSATSLPRLRRQLKWDTSERSRDSRTTTVPGFIDWGPTGGDDGSEDDGRAVPSTTVSVKATTTITTTASTTTKRPRNSEKVFVVTTMLPRRQSTTPPSVSYGETAKPAKPFGDTAGLAVHQIITITVSLIMVIAALITTLVLKNCCAQRGNGRHNSHQRKINQQEESCQNLTDFTPARVPSSVDIFTAYNDSLQCSHECVRTPVPIYTDEMIQHTPVYKMAYNGNRPPPTERQLIPVAFVSEKWFEISC
ncbi:adherens junction-associated protein 1 [Paramormyrops kingsleyae]|uniref:Adherens junctions associated protein 1 n=1 Tax=Paramormyrops kingsleyae TaxID=1676925 RepID=A0A3B3SNX6_9TELE|nr:adherens junction-associated protein 1 [Paramormyrops kingsleyae]